MIIELVSQRFGRSTPLVVQRLRRLVVTTEQAARWVPLGIRHSCEQRTAPQRVISRIGQIAGPDAYYVAGVGQRRCGPAQFIEYEKPGHWINSGGLGTMGFAVPAAMGAKVGSPDSVVWAIDGDGCFK